MLAGALVSLLIMGAPSDAAKALRVAWASQYEWKESGVANAVLDFTYSYHWKGAEKDQEWRYGGRAQVVLAEGKIVRRHYPAVTKDRRKQIDPHVVWVLGRFMRRPFEEEFKEMVFEGPDPYRDGLLRVSAAPSSAPDSKHYYLLKEGRLAGRDAFSYTVGTLADGYAVLGEDWTWTKDDKTSSTSRLLKVAESKEHPCPQSYTYRLSTSGGTSEVRIDFNAPTVNVEHPVVGDPAARDAVKQGWTSRYVLPSDIRITAQFHRRVDKDLAMLHWWDTVKGKLQVWGMDRIRVALDERLFPDPSWTSEIQRLCDQHFGQLFAWMHDEPFEKAFAGCGFEFIEAEDGTVAVLVYGYEGALGFLLKEGKIAGYLRNVAVEEGWWRFRLKKTRGDRMRIESMSTKRDKRTCKLRIQYTRRGGVEVPRHFEMIGGPRSGATGEGWGVAEYDLKKIKVTLPR